MTESTSEQPSRIAVVVSSNKMNASVQCADLGEEPLTREEVVQALEREGIAVKQEVIERVDEFVRLAKTGELPEGRFRVAKGKQPVEGKDEEFEWDPAYEQHVQDWRSDSAVNYYNFDAIITVKQDTTIGTVHPLVPSESGEDVCGKEIPPVLEPQRIELDANIRRSSEDGTQIIAAISGRMVIETYSLVLLEVLIVPGDVDFETCDVDSEVDVDVKGSVLDRFEVKSVKSITVGGTVEAAQVHAAENVIVCGGIMGRLKGLVSAGGEIVARFGHEANLRAEGDIKIHNQISNCRVQTEQQFLAEHGAVIGGHLFAKEGALIGTAGSDGYVLTQIIIGLHPGVLREVAEMDVVLERKRRVLNRMRAQIRALGVDEKRLTPEQQEEYANLHIESGALEFETGEKEERRDELLQQARSEQTPKLQVSQIIYPGVVISIGWHALAIAHELAGPVSFELREAEEGMEFAVTKQSSGVIEAWPATDVSVDDLLEGLRGEQAQQSDDVAEATSKS